MGSILFILLICILLCGVRVGSQTTRKMIVTNDELENHISPEDLEEFFQMYQNKTLADPELNGDLDSADAFDQSTAKSMPDLVDCYGLGTMSRQMLKLFNMKPDDAMKVNTHFFFSSRKSPFRVQVFPGAQFGLEYVDFDPNRKTVMIVHGFMSHSNASWVHDMTKAFLQWGDVNVIAVDWSGGGNTWKYWRAVANTRTVGYDINVFMKQIMQATGARVKDFHFVGHSLGAHISSFASYLLGGVSRITGLDPAQPCFATANDVERLDPSDADYVDIIHTNGRMLKKIGFGMPEPMGHADFYPNGGLKQPGCINSPTSVWSRMISNNSLQQAVCSHGRAYSLFTESLINNRCSFRAYRWDLTYNGINVSLKSDCKGSSCAEMGINADGGQGGPRARGVYFLYTTDRDPYCVPKNVTITPSPELLNDIRRMEPLMSSTKRPNVALAYADPELYDQRSYTATGTKLEVTTEKGWFSKIFGWMG